MQGYLHVNDSIVAHFLAEFFSAIVSCKGTNEFFWWTDEAFSEGRYRTRVYAFRVELALILK